MWMRRGDYGTWANGVVLACLLGAACSEKEPPLVTEKSWDREVARMVTVRGIVTDGENGTAVAGAEITLPDGEHAVTGSDGHFEIQTKPGRKRVEVKSSEYLRFTYDLVAGEADFDSSIKVARRGPSQSIGMTGGTLTSEEAIIEVPAGAYPNGSSVSVTALKRSRVAAVPAPAQFVDEKGVPRRVVGVVAMEGSSSPSVPLRVRTPVAPDATMDTVLLHKIDARGEWTDPKRPESIVGGMATFAVSDDGQYGVTMDAARSDSKRIGYVVTDSGDSAVAAGSVLTGGTQVVAGKRVVSVVDPRGATIEVAPNSLITLDDPAGADGMSGGGGAGGEAMAAPYAGRVRATAGEGRVVVRRSAAAATAAAGRVKQSPGPYLFVFWLPGAILGVDGGAFTYSTCPHGTGTLDTVGVVDGLLYVFFGDEWATLLAGQSRILCPTCQGTAAPQCGEEPAAPPQLARLTVSPAEIPFDDLMSGETSPPRTITVTNAGNAPSGPLTVKLGGGPFEIQANGCTALLPAGSSCQLSVVFHPTAAGNSQGDVSIGADPGGTASVTLAGQGLGPPQLSMLPAAYTFAPQVTGAPGASTTLVIHNEGDLPTGPLTTALQGASAANFRLAQDGCTGRSLAARTFCEVQVTFLPLTTGELTAEVVVSGTPGGQAIATLGGRGLEPALLVASTRQLSFGDQLAGTVSDVRTVDISNGGEEPTGPLALTLDGSAQFEVADDGCQGAVLPPAGSCRVGLVFRPSAAGPAAATLNIGGLPGGSVAVAVDGRGLGAAQLSVSPASAGFDDQVLGTASGPVLFTLTNEGDVPTGALNAGLTGAGAAQFHLGASSCGGLALGPHLTCTVEVIFQPSDPDESTAALVVTGSPGGEARADLRGRGLAPATLTVSPGAVSFPDQLVGTAGAPAAFTFTNVGDVTSGAVTVALGGIDVGQYEMTQNGCGSPLPPKTSCAVTLLFRPTAAGNASATVAGSAMPGGIATATLVGRGLGPAHLVIAPLSAAFGDVLVGGTSAPTTFTVTNDGDQTSGVLSAGLGGVSAPQYHVESNGCQGVTLGAKASCSISVVLAPTAAGDASASLFVDASLGGSAAASLSGRGQTPAHLTISPPGIAFGDRVLGDTGAESPVTVTNDGDVAASALGTSLTGPGAAQFAIGTNGCAGVALAGHGSCTVGLIFHPTVAGDSAATFTVTGAPGGAAAALSGHGLTPGSLSVNPTTFTFPDLLVGQTSAPQVFTFTNGGDVATGPLAVVTGGSGAAQYHIQNDGCSGQSLPPHGSCTASVTFAPNAPGDVPPAALAAAASPGGSTSASLGARALRPAQLRIDPPELAFGSVALDAPPSSLTFTVFNDGDQPSGLPDGFLEGPGAPYFNTPNLPPCAHAPLPPHSSCPVDIAFHPGTPGPTQALLTVSAAPGGSAQVNLTGAGLESARLTVSPDQFDFGPVPPGQSRQTTFIVTNSGVNPAGTVGVTIEGPDQTEYGLLEDACSGRTLAPGETCPVTARFSPHIQGFRTANLTVRGSQSGGTVSALLRGSGGEGGGTCTPESCGPGMLCCGSFCADARFDQNNCGGCGHACAAGQFCNNGICGCSPMQVECNGVCTFLQGDPDNCGACGNACPAGNRFCGQGPTGPTCQPCSSAGQIECNGRCVDLRHDQQNCGTCGQACGANQACIEGNCVTGTCALTCPAGTLCCEGGVEGGGQRCTDARYDQNNCGGCGIVCGPGRYCNNGVCGCQPGQVDCNGVCSYLQGDPDNCGACGNVCPTGSRFCSGGPKPPPPGPGPGGEVPPGSGGGSCQPCSYIGQIECGGRCVDTHYDNANCGACGTACGAGEGCVNGTCIAGTCATSCGGGSICCTSGPVGPEPGRDSCVNPLYDQNNCGGCGVACTGGRFCANGVCSCNPMQVECNGVCTNVFGDPDNCGSCGHVCPAGARFCSGAMREGFDPCQPCSSIAQVECNGRCADLQNDQNNCGACGQACGANQACVAGTCVSGTCAQACNPGAVCCGEGTGLPGTPEGGQKCSDLRYDQNNCGGCGIACGPNHYCNNGVCGCQPGLVECNGTCTYPFGGDPDNCGACGTACPDGSRFCGYGPAGLGCYACNMVGQTECNGRCVDMQTDASNCGACGQACGANQACVGGACVTGTCAFTCGPGSLCCSSGPTGPEPGREMCIGPLYDQNNCGACGNVCGGGKFCQNGTCACPGGMLDCNGVCAFVQGGDPDNCGACGNVCPPGSRLCGPGPAGPNPVCQPCANFGQTECNGRCVDTHNDQNNCGACGTACATGQACVDGTCVDGSCTMSCPGGWLCCGSPDRPFCSDPHNDYGNCGGCGNVCGPGQFCNNGQCSCGSPSLVNCDGTCRDLRNDPEACGTCGNVCPPEARFCVPDPEPTCRPCPGPGQALCDGLCIDTRSDHDNCGTCGHGCGDGNSCLNGNCVVGTCTISCGGGSICCGTEATGQTCSYPGFDRNNCGGCGIVCGPTQSCNNGICGCQPYEASCGGSCVDVHRDADNCGACGNVCPAGSRFCSNDHCLPCEAVGQSECDGRCIDMQNDQNNCGACGNACEAGSVCSNGRCLAGNCPINCGGGSICCSSPTFGDTCSYPGFDRNNCGGCGIVCPATQSCNNGVCGCQPYEASCGGTCVDVHRDADNCGACGRVCPTGNRFCNGDQCQPCSVIGQTGCDGRCVDMQNDPANCGACRNACGAGEVCSGGRCLAGNCPINCGGGSICCTSPMFGETCSYPGFDRNNCGGCGIVCADTQSCNNGVCGCQPYEANCGGTCLDVHRDPQNCGACGHVCPTGNRFCNGDQCQPCSAIGQTECDGRCVDMHNDQANCGACGNVCAPNQVCLNSACISGQ